MGYLGAWSMCEPMESTSARRLLPNLLSLLAKSFHTVSAQQASHPQPATGEARHCSRGVSAASASLNVVVDASKKILVAAHASDKCRCASPASCAAHSHRHEGSDDSWEISNGHF